MPLDDRDTLAPGTLGGDGSPALRPEPGPDPELLPEAWKRRFLATSRAYLCAPLPAPAPAPPVELRRGPSSAVLRKRLRLATALTPR